MHRIMIKSALAAILSALASLAIASAFFEATGGSLDGRALMLSIVCPLVIAWPASAYKFRQSERLKRLLDELRHAHEELSAAHADLAQAHAELEDANARLTERTRHDDMTGLLNRESFMEALECTLEKGGKGALLIVDADNFKLINDTHGHLAGDDALMLISAAIGRGLREGDLLGRIGGEEFCASCRRYRAQGGQPGGRAHPQPGRERSVLAGRWARRAFRSTVSIGGAEQRPRPTLSELMREADRATLRGQAVRAAIASSFSAAMSRAA